MRIISSRSFVVKVLQRSHCSVHWDSSAEGEYLSEIMVFHCSSKQTSEEKVKWHMLCIPVPIFYRGAKWTFLLKSVDTSLEDLGCHNLYLSDHRSVYCLTWFSVQADFCHPIRQEVKAHNLASRTAQSRLLLPGCSKAKFWPPLISGSVCDGREPLYWGKDRSRHCGGPSLKLSIVTRKLGGFPLDSVQIAIPRLSVTIEPT